MTTDQRRVPSTPSAPAKPQSPTDEELMSWYSQPEVCQLLKISKRWLNEQLQDGAIVIERRQRTIRGLPRGSRRKKYETCYKPSDVDALAEAKFAAPSIAFSSLSKAGYGSEFSRLFEQVIEMIARRHQVDRGPWMTVEQAAEFTGLTRARVRRLAQRMLAEHHPDVIQDGHLKIRRAALGEVDAHDLADKPALPPAEAAAAAAPAAHRPRAMPLSVAAAMIGRNLG